MAEPSCGLLLLRLGLMFRRRAPWPSYLVSLLLGVVFRTFHGRHPVPEESSGQLGIEQGYAREHPNVLSQVTRSAQDAESQSKMKG